MYGTWNWGVLCETWNWSHPYEISLELRVTGMALLEVALDNSICQMSLLCLKHSEDNDMGGLCFEQLTRYVELYTSKQPTPSAYRVSLQGECWLGVTEGSDGF